MARMIDADELEMFPYSEVAGTEEQIADWIEQVGLSGDDTASRARNLCWKVIEGFINVVKTQPTLTQPPITGDTSDGYHTFNELYRHRAILFSVICNERPEVSWKSKRHHDGTMYDGMFIVGIDTPEGQATYHYDINPYWNLFRVKELELAPEWDGHTPGEAIRRIGTLTQPNEPLTLEVLAISQLFQMLGEKVEVIRMGEMCQAEWATVRSFGDCKTDSGCSCCHELYGKTWIAYRRPPEGDADA